MFNCQEILFPFYENARILFWKKLFSLCLEVKNKASSNNTNNFVYARTSANMFDYRKHKNFFQKSKWCVNVVKDRIHEKKW